MLIAVGLLMLYPLLWMVGGAFKPNHEIFDSIGFIPHEPTLEGSPRAGGRAPNTRSRATCCNTFAIIVPKVVVTVISSVLVAFGFARFKSRARRSVRAPHRDDSAAEERAAVPQYLMFREMGWLDTFLPL